LGRIHGIHHTGHAGLRVALGTLHLASGPGM
jgi:hypothetical protein